MGGVRLCAVGAREGKMEEVKLTTRVGPMARRVIAKAGGSLTGRGTKKDVTFQANKVWRFSTGADYLVGWNVLTHYKSKNILRCRHPRLLTIRQLDEIDKLILPRLKDGADSSEVAQAGDTDAQ
jgi:hypothetical protein